MKKLLALCAGTMLLATAAMAGPGDGLHISWINCPNVVGATPTEVFLCDGGQVHNLNGTFSLAASTPGVIAVDGIVDLLFNASPDTPPFWQFQSGGCNETGIIISGGKPSAGCGTALQNSNLMCAAGGGSCSSLITAYAFGSSINFPANRARLLFTLARASTAPVTLGATTGTNAHFAFTLTFFEDNAVGLGGADCVGCQAKAGITWNWLTIYNNTPGVAGEAIAGTISSTDSGSANASVGANCTIDCVAVAAKNRTWGQLKSLYR